MKERERKFKLRYLPEGLEAHDIVQGYVMIDGSKHLRCRIIDGYLAYLTYKNVVNGIERDEYEFPLNADDAKEIMSTCKYILKKTRFSTEFNGNHVDIDFVYEPVHLAFIEVEFDDELTEIPPYCGDEVTDDSRYSNINIAMSYGTV